MTVHRHHPSPIAQASYSAMELSLEDDVVWMLDQRLLPRVEKYERLTRVEEVAEGIRAMIVRGAPAIGISAAYGVVLAARGATGDAAAFARAMGEADTLLRSTRPTAVNLMWALDRMAGVVREVASRDHTSRVERLAAEARAIHSEDVAACRTMGALGAREVPDGATILTHCNAGALATGGYGTALGVIRAARDAGKRVRVLASETRPYLQGMRLTAWELHRDGIQVEIVPDNAVGYLMSKGEIQFAVVGADRIARTGDVANKIGTYTHACMASLHGVPFYVAAPWSTVDMACPSGKDIPIEERSAREVTSIRLPVDEGRPGNEAREVPIGPEGVSARHPAFDVTPARYIRAIFTERGAASPPGEASLRALAAGSPIRASGAGLRAAEPSGLAS
jgi:methylthioribose-1-phosphate isomerase